MIICGYSFTPIHKPDSCLSKIINSNAASKHCILPISLYGSKDTNRQLAIDLINSGVSVSIEAMNHSKWMMSEKSIYFGSANFTKTSFEKRVEVVTFADFAPNDPLLADFAAFTKSSISKLRRCSYRSKLHGVINKNAALASLASKSVKRLNPDIRKVRYTLEHINNARSALHAILQNAFWLIENDRYFDIYNRASKMMHHILRIESTGNKLINQTSLNKLTIEKYNFLCDSYIGAVDIFAASTSDHILSSQNEPDFSIINRRLASRNYKIIKDIT